MLLLLAADNCKVEVDVPQGKLPFDVAVKLGDVELFATAIVCVDEQPFDASVTVTVYCPIFKLRISSVFLPLLHWYEYGPVPPVTVMKIAPLLSPQHLTDQSESIPNCNNEGSVTTALDERMQPFASITITE